MNIINSIYLSLCDSFARTPALGEWVTAVVRFSLPVLALLMLATLLRALLAVRHTAETWGFLAIYGDPDDADTVTEHMPLVHWENLIGRHKSMDVQLQDGTVSRTHAALLRDHNDNWAVTDLGSTGGTYVNGERIAEQTAVPYGATLNFAGVEAVLEPLSPHEKKTQKILRAKADKPIPPWGVLSLLTIFQLLTCLQLIVARGADLTVGVPLSFFGLTALMWGYCLFMRTFGRVGFEMELIAFFLCTLSLSITASKSPSAVPKQFFAVVAGMCGFLVLCWILRDLKRTAALRVPMATLAVGLLAFTLLFGSEKFGATNWIQVGNMTLQPSEISKICYIFAGAAPLSLLFHKRNIT